MNTIARIGVYVLVFAAGGGVGTYIGYRIAEAKAFAHEMAEVSRHSEYLQVQRTKGSDVAYEDALKAYLASLEMRSAAVIVVVALTVGILLLHRRIDRHIRSLKEL